MIPANECLRLHIGGWERRTGWSILNIEARPETDFVGDASDLSRFPEESADEVYASHVYEQLNYADEVQRAVSEVLRVLKPGGSLKISVPDLAVLCDLFRAPGISLLDRSRLMRIFMDGRTNQFDFHKVLFDFDLLESLLQQRGSESVKRVQQFNLFEDGSVQRFAGVPVSLNVAACKPRAQPAL